MFVMEKVPQLSQPQQGSGLVRMHTSNKVIKKILQQGRLDMHPIWQKNDPKGA